MANTITQQEKALLKPSFSVSKPQADSPHLTSLISKLNLIPHPEGGYFVETDRDPLQLPFPVHPFNSTRNASTTIHYLLTPSSPLGAWHRNKARTVHTLHRGRGIYVIIHADEVASERWPGGYGGEDENEKKAVSEEERWVGKARVEVIRVGQDVLGGEKLQWIVEGGKYKTSFLLPDQDGGSESEGLLISETVVPGFEYTDHDFMKKERLEALVTEEEVKVLEWMLRKE